MKTMFRLFSTLLVAVVLISCEKTSGPPQGPYPAIEAGEGVFIINEGNFQWSNASLSYYKKSSGETFHDLYYQINGETPGDVLQSIALHDDQLWLVMNNSSKIVAIDLYTGEKTAAIEGLTSPRQFLPINQTKAYVTDLFAGHIHVIDMSTLEVSGNIALPGYSEALISAAGKVIVGNMDSGMIHAIDPATDQLSEGLAVGPGPVAMVNGGGNMIWVLCGGTWESTQGANLVKVDAASWEIAASYELPERNFAYSRLAISNDGSQLFFLGGDVWMLDASAAQPQAEVFLSAEGMSLYGLGIDPYTNNLYVSDAIDYTQNGQVLRYSIQGQHIETFQAGIIPSGFLFY
jgi:outer membrane protein assembly factor BamB